MVEFNKEELISIVLLLDKEENKSQTICTKEQKRTAWIHVQKN